MGKAGKGRGVGGDNRLRVVCTGSIDESLYCALGWFRSGAPGRLWKGGRERATPGGNYLQVPRKKVCQDSDTALRLVHLCSLSLSAGLSFRNMRCLPGASPRPVAWAGFLIDSDSRR